MSIFQKTVDVPKPAPEPVPGVATIIPTPESEVREAAKVKRNTELKVFLHEKLLGMLNLSALERATRDELSRELAPLVKEMLADEGIVLNMGEYNQLVAEVLDEVLGLGPLEPLLKDPTISDILVNTHSQVFVERAGKLEPTRTRFKDE